MAQNIVGWLWDFGDGETSSLQSPYHIYRRSGRYTVSLTIEVSDGTKKTTTKEVYIIVDSETSHVPSLGVRPDKVCLHLGLDDEDGGWGYYSGDQYVWPESAECIVPIEIGDRLLDVVFDGQSGLPFIMNTQGSRGDDATDEVFRDKVGHPLQPEGYPIKTSLTTRMYVGQDRQQRVKHEETYFNVSAARDGRILPDGLEIDAYLLNDGVQLHVEEMRDLVQDEEVLFTTKKISNGFQLRIDTNDAEFKISDIGTVLKADAKSRYVTKVVSPDKSFQQFLGNAYYYVSRGSSRNLATGDSAYTGYTNTVGPDTFNDSAFEIPALGFLAIDVGANFSSATLWTKDPSKVVDLGGPITIEELTVNGDWYLLLITAMTSTILTLQETEYFDIRINDTAITDLTWYDQYIHDVIYEKGHKYLPRYYG